jgi:predicted Rossmann-fold nucleotide-binding protein
MKMSITPTHITTSIQSIAVYCGSSSGMQHSVAQGFVRADNNQQLLIDTDVDALLVKMNAFVPMNSDEWLRSKY